ncbi:hypothetical protein ACLOJK_033013 [Asimina triloba]
MQIVQMQAAAAADRRTSMAVELCSEASSSTRVAMMSPRISFSQDLSQSDGSIPVDRHGLDPTFLDSDFNFCIRCEQESSSADELFSGGKILPLLFKDSIAVCGPNSATGTPHLPKPSSATPPSPMPPPKDAKRESLREPQLGERIQDNLLAASAFQKQFDRLNQFEFEASAATAAAAEGEPQTIAETGVEPEPEPEADGHHHTAVVPEVGFEEKQQEWEKPIEILRKWRSDQSCFERAALHTQRNDGPVLFWFLLQWEIRKKQEEIVCPIM